MTWEKLDRKIWRMWKDKYTLYRMAKEISHITFWSEYLSLSYIVGYLHNKKGIGFSRKVLRYAFNKIPPEEIEGCEKEAWAWILEKGGYKFERGKMSRKGESKNTPYLSSFKPKIADEGISPGEEYNYTPPGEKVPES